MLGKWLESCEEERLDEFEFGRSVFTPVRPVWSPASSSVAVCPHLSTSVHICPRLSIMAAELSPLTTHVLNTADGVPAARMALSLHRLDSRLMIWNMISVGTTGEDGRCPGLIARPDFLPGLYKLRFETGPYWESRGHLCFYPYVEVVFPISECEERFHLPLLLSRFSYSTYRGT